MQEGRASLRVNGSSDYLRTVFDRIADGVAVFNADCTIIDVNPAILKSLGYSRDELVGRKCHEVLHREPGPCTEVICPLKDMKKTSRSEKGIIHTHYTKDGTPITVEISAASITDGAGAVAGMVEVARDITERTRAAQRRAAHYAIAKVLSESDTLEEATPLLLEAVCTGLGWDMGEIWDVERKKDLLRYTDNWHLPQKDLDEFAAHSRGTTFAFGEGLPGRVWKTARPEWVPDVASDACFIRTAKAAEVGLHGAFAFPILMGGQVLGVMVFFSRQMRRPDRDLLKMMAAVGSSIGQFIERRQAEGDLRESEERFRSVSESAVDPIVTADAQGRICYWNPAAETVFGYKDEEIMGRPVTEIVPARYRDAHEKAYQMAVEAGISDFKGRVYEVAALGRDGEFPVEISVAGWKSGDEPFFTAIIRDTTKRKRAEREALDAKNRMIEQMKHHEGYVLEVADGLRNPLQVFIGLLEDFDTADISEEQRKRFNAILEASRLTEENIKRLTGGEH